MYIVVFWSLFFASDINLEVLFKSLKVLIAALDKHDYLNIVEEDFVLINSKYLNHRVLQKLI